MNTPSHELDLKSTLSQNHFAGLWRLMSGYRLLYAGALVSLGLATIARTGAFLLLQYLVDKILGQRALAWQLPWIALGFVGLALFQGAFAFLSGRLSAQTAESIALRLRNYLYNHIQRLSFAYHDKTQTGDLVQRSTSDVDAVRRFFSEQAIGSGRIALMFIVNLIAVLTMNWKLALLSILVVPFLVAVSIFFFRRVTKAYEAYQEQEATLSTTLQENLTGVRVVKAFARQEFEKEKFERENKEKYTRGRRLALMHSSFWPTSDVLCHGQMLFGYTVGALMVLNAELTLGEYMAYLGVIGMLIWPMRDMGRLIVQMATGLVSYGRVTQVIKQDREPLAEGACQPAGAPRGELIFDDVCFSYDGTDANALKNISFRCEPGQAVALLGSTGSGKTTLVNLLPRFYDYTRGHLTLDGHDLKDYARHYLRQNIGIVEQEPFLFSRSIRENITYGVGRNVPDDEVEAAARAAAIHDVIMAFPNGYSTLVGEKGVTLSGGQKQRVAIARTLLKDPRILILDDATSSVDTQTEAEIRGALQRLMQGRTTLIIAHRIQSVMNADLILVLDQGRIVQRGTHDELLEQDGIYRQIYDIQTHIEAEVEKEIASADGSNGKH